MTYLPDATAISGVVDLLVGVLQLAAAVVTLLAAAVSVRGRRSGRGEDDARRTLRLSNRQCHCGMSMKSRARG
ncbi:hypothetical protein [Micromonospora sp. NPDC005324]|uniref:hypothetical protein n=1 Tax=Micromonospora sp. NPDC005324 TaxID=3157033 RepID=UPI0033B7DE3B